VTTVVGKPTLSDVDGRTAIRVRFDRSVQLTKGEAFSACQALADADRRLIGSGFIAEAGALGDLFDLLEDRLTDHHAGSAWYSMDSELTQ
jgi:hypothetical protein